MTEYTISIDLLDNDSVEQVVKDLGYSLLCAVRNKDNSELRAMQVALVKDVVHAVHLLRTARLCMMGSDREGANALMAEFQECMIPMELKMKMRWSDKLI